MAKVMLRENDDGKVLFYVAKKDMEEIIESLEFDTDAKWGGNVNLTNGDIWFIEPDVKTLPNEVNAKIIKRGEED
ncbi:MAG: putative nitrogen fixation protein NifT [Epsilonproteobacteria bacterium]|nr:putative nitrogen fixation protein NifT [Campylobacterota bacterium]OIO15444.1 MAG: putative nitrogen fixation protein NifT [Helicobacteraceae bacterium CG1_02_36_14]PIP10986.1 MAG: putative nitrogen fixation protein NifT [Sulfurimonas sp. CG23_combo_of_CG06-09_8_20_14_all_36_33]PIS25794.1 MAG: putative nitrogen fixation protein NifT [Sulfurimonas sp. CG08_land_8_20_14_0_20_36_33]PIU34394.1 MAG: putative nitrogen fixation protein NifT [Sulfurimonas sp. CG07_land_8_20_14_0_80_36_56]PIV02736.